MSPNPVRLARRVAVLSQCSRSEADQYIKGGWVTVDGQVVEDPAYQVLDEAVAIDPAARLTAVEPATILLQRHFNRLTPIMPLDAEASGLMVLTQDGRVWRRLSEDRDDIEQEFVVEVAGDIAPYGLSRLNHGLAYGGRPLPPCKQVALRAAGVFRPVVVEPIETLDIPCAQDHVGIGAPGRHPGQRDSAAEPDGAT